MDQGRKLRSVIESGDMIEQMVSFKEREEIVGTAEYMEQEALYSA